MEYRDIKSMFGLIFGLLVKGHELEIITYDVKDHELKISIYYLFLLF